MSVAGGDAPIDSVSDAGLAIDEAAALLLEVPGTTHLCARINTSPGGVELVLQGDATSDAWPPRGYEASLAADVLNALARRVEFQDAGGAEILLEL